MRHVIKPILAVTFTAAMIALASPAMADGSGGTGPISVFATTKPIPGVGVRVCKNPGGSSARYFPRTSGADGSFAYTGLEPGLYEVTIPGRPVQLFRVGANGVLRGTVLEAGGVMQVQSKTNALVSAAEAAAIDAAGAAQNLSGPVHSQLRLLDGSQVPVDASWEQTGDTALVTVTTSSPLPRGQLAPFAAAARGIKDNGVKLCPKCGVTSGRIMPSSVIRGDRGTFQVSLSGLKSPLQKDQIDAILQTPR